MGLKLKIVNKAEMAQILGITMRTFDEHLRSGCPFNQKGGRGKEWEFETSAVINWSRDREKLKSSGLEDSKKRKAAADAELAELKAGKELGLYVEIDEVVKSVVEDYIIIKTQFSQIPKRLPPVLVNESPEAMAKILSEEIGAVFDSIKNRFITERGSIAEAAQECGIVPDAPTEINC